MSGETGNDLAVLVAQEVAKQLPLKDAYQDGVSPAAKQIGGLLEDLTKVVRLALAPIQYGAALQDRFRRFIETSALRVPEDRRIPPIPKILGPVLEGIRYEPEGSMSDEAFSRLLSRAFDRERVGQAHPAFPNLLRVLSDDELEILKILENGLICVGYAVRQGSDEIQMPHANFVQAYPFLKHPTQMLVYCEHIESLGLIRPLVGVEGSPAVDGIPVLWTLRLSDFGRLFVSAVLAELA